MSNRNLVFNDAVRGFHAYKTNWKGGELLKCSHEEDNSYNIFSMKVCKPDSDEIVGQLPMEISRITKFMVDWSANCTLKIRGIHYRRSPLVQGGLEVPREVTITMIGSVINHLLLTRYESLLKGWENCGHFPFISQHANEIGETVEAEPRPRPPKPQRQKKKEVYSIDIRDMFRN